MARHKPILAFDAKMYKHFAIVTVSLTFAIALFADGEKRAVVVENVAAVQEYAEKDKPGPKLIIANSNAGSAGGPGLAGFYGDVGQNIYGTGFASSTVRSSRRLSKLARSITDAQLASLGLSKAQFLALSDDEKEEILVKLNNGKSPMVTESVVKRSTSASLKRSGRSGPSADY